MFTEPKPGTEYIFKKDNKTKYTSDYASVVQFVQKNEVIPEALKFFKDHEKDVSNEDTKNISNLARAINTGKLDDPLYSHPKAQLYLLFLLQNKLISFDNFTTANLYIVTLMQHATLPALKVEDQDLKRITKVEALSLDDPNVKKIIMSSITKLYYKKEDPYITDFELKSHLSHLEQAIAEANGFEKLVIRFKKPPYKIYPSKEGDYLRHFFDRCPLFGADEEYYYLPSTRLINLILPVLRASAFINYDPKKREVNVKMAPIFGKVGEKTLYQLHQINVHPIDLYMLLVKNNPLVLDGERVGPLDMAMHDIVHFFWANLFSTEEYQFLFEYLLPTLAQEFGIKKIDPHEFLYEVMDINFDTGIFIPGNYLTKALYFICTGDDKDNPVEKSLKIMESLHQHADVIKEKFNISIGAHLNSLLFQDLSKHYDHEPNFRQRNGIVQKALEQGIDPVEYYKSQLPSATKK